MILVYSLETEILAHFIKNLNFLFIQLKQKSINHLHIHVQQKCLKYLYSYPEFEFTAFCKFQSEF